MARKPLVYETGGPEVAHLRQLHMKLIGRPGCKEIRLLRAEVLDSYGMSESAESCRNMED
jgi:hypothetical protein